ncbi:MAG: EAL domain-containing protein [Burkholderiaceae bacterium]|nr:EAL domain-containing protein [Burkholderiaceae bacterium]
MQAEQTALKEVSSYAEAYSQYLTRSIGQMDQVTMQLKQSWEQSPNGLQLEELKRAGMFTDPAFVGVSIIDQHGRVLSSTGRPASSVRESDYFIFHRNNISTALRISVPQDELRGRQAAVQFTRRLDGPDDAFLGVVVLTVHADYFTSYFSPRTLGQLGSVAMVGESRLRLERHGDQVSAAPGASLFADLSFIAPTEGALALPGAAFGDNRARSVGWHHSLAYPVAAIASLAQEDAMAAPQAYWRQLRDQAVVVTIVLAALAAWGTVLSRRALVRRAEADEVQRAYRTATESANDGFYMVAAVRGRDGEIVDFEVVDCNERGAYFYGITRQQLVGARISTLEGGVFGDQLMATYLAAMRSGFHDDERRMPDDNRLNIAWGRRRIVRVGNSLAVTLQDISQRKSHERDLVRMASQDMLTGLPNRHWLNQHLPAALDAAEVGGYAVALLFIDLDEFKHVNDTQGHAAGDQLLQMAASRLRSLLRPSDQVVRFGGDEFIVLLDPAESDAHIGAVAERILAAFTRPFVVAEESQSVGASVGISVYPRDGSDPETLIKHGDIAMYSGKSEGKGQYRFFDPSLYITLKSRSQLKHSLVEAIEKGQLQLHYQPRVDTQTGELCSMEALVRWQHPELGLVPPAKFIPLAESSGLILRIGEIVLELACAQLAQWRAEGLTLVPVSVNVSPKQFAHGNIHHQLALHLKRHSLAPSLLEVEITESAMMADHPEVLAELAAIRDLGVKLHVDDFGTGYSSLSQLQKLKMDVLKVDKAFTCELDKSAEGRVFFQAIVSMAHALGMSVVAEGVETGRQLDILRELRCNEVQGYYIARPQPPLEMAALMRKRWLLPEEIAVTS